jgi:type VI secretion system secreted protein Hcp
MAIDAYLQIDGIKGESQDSAHQGWIEPPRPTGA